MTQAAGSSKSLAYTSKASVPVLPTEILINMLSHLPAYEMARARMVCKQWRDIVDHILKDDSVWEKYCKRDYPKVAEKALWSSPYLKTWLGVYRSLTLWPQLPLAQDKVVEVFQTNTVEDEIRKIVLQENGHIMIHKRGDVSYHHVDTMEVSKRRGFSGQYSKVEELQDVMVMLGLNSQLHVVKKPRPNWTYHVIINTSYDDEITFHNVQSFMIADRTLFYYTFNHKLFAFNLDNDKVAHPIILESFDEESIPKMGSWGYKDGCLNILTVTKKLFVYRKGQVQLKCTLNIISNLVDFLYRYGMLENLDWHQYDLLHSDNKDPLISSGFLRYVSIIKIYKEDLFFVATQCIVSVKIYYKPFDNGVLDFSKFNPIREYHLSDQVGSIVHVDYLIINTIEVLEMKDGHKVLVSAQGRIFVISFDHIFGRPVSGALAMVYL